MQTQDTIHIHMKKDTQHSQQDANATGPNSAQNAGPFHAVLAASHVSNMLRAIQDISEPQLALEEPIKSVAGDIFSDDNPELTALPYGDVSYTKTALLGDTTMQNDCDLELDDNGHTLDVLQPADDLSASSNDRFDFTDKDLSF
ncbi:hypothetical protein A0H81_02824 [Grifola frondosa]|uniref:Uncharacterized protein n=1 Tax=Grifola frondosa TaxID=5627 RepID=A0A1C7MLA9_GRIFR|nr:hypothetical protein A0H81_02824 [Grifola frondosa]